MAMWHDGKEQEGMGWGRRSLANTSLFWAWMFNILEDGDLGLKEGETKPYVRIAL